MDQVIQKVSDFLQTLSWVDYVIAAGIARGIFVGYKSGGFVELVRYLNLGLTLALLIAFTPTLAAYVQTNTLLSEDLSQKVVIVLVGLIAYMLFRTIFSLILKFASMDNNWVMKVIGMLLGAFRWAILLSFALYAVNSLQLVVVGKDVLEKSRWGSAIGPIAPNVVEFASGIVPRATLNLK
jgi:uncharacterized membrane protein required for colicin V production